MKAPIIELRRRVVLTALGLLVAGALVGALIGLQSWVAAAVFFALWLVFALLTVGLMPHRIEILRGEFVVRAFLHTRRRRLEKLRCADRAVLGKRFKITLPRGHDVERDLIFAAIRAANPPERHSAA